MTEFIFDCYQARRKKLLEWRQRYKKNIYTSKVVMNLFYDLYALIIFWEDDDIKRYFQDVNSPFLSIRDAMGFVIQKYRTIQTELVAPELDDLLIRYPEVFGINWNTVQPLVNKANNGSNKDVEEVEFSYIYYGAISQLSLLWMGHLLTGYNSAESYKTIIGVDTENKELGSLSSLFTHIYSDIAIYFNLIVGSERKGFYKELPNFW